MKIPQFYNYCVIFSNTLRKQYSLALHRVIPVSNSSSGVKSFISRNFSVQKPPFNSSESSDFRARTTRNYVVALGVLTLGAAYAAVPLYRIFCQASGYGGTVQHDLGGEKIQNLQAKPYRKITVRFMSDVSTKLQWKFEPQQKEIVVVPGETALAFYTATNPLDEPIIGISTYNVLPFEAGQYFNKIQCFCFEEQQLNPKEQVDMPVFFYIDPEFCEDPMMERVDEVVLSYTFFQAKDGMSLAPLINSVQKQTR